MAAQVSAQIAADAQVAASQFAAEGLGHAFVLRKPLAKVTPNDAPNAVLIGTSTRAMK
jgi:hypothetical protein